MLTFIEEAISEEVFWDICCDHGYVGIKALRTEQFSKVHFVDQVPHIMERLQTLIEEAPRPFGRPYALHLKSGEDLNEEVSGNVLVAGVGGLTIKNIIESLLKKKLLRAKRLLLSPHTDEKVLVKFIEEEIFKNSYELVKKIEIEENKRMRPLYVFNQRSQAF